MLIRHNTTKSEILAVLDIGTSKVCCLIAEVFPSRGAENVPTMRVLGFGHQRSYGMKAGYVADFDAAESSIRRAVSQAEAEAGMTLSKVIVNVTCGRMRSMHYCAHADLATGQVRNADVERVSAAAFDYAEQGGRTAIHMNRVAYLLDGQPDIVRPVGMAGKRLSAQYHAVTVDEPALSNVLAVIRRALLEPDTCVPAGYASALAATTEHERRNGVIVIDIGAGTMDIAVMAEDRLMSAEVLPFGSGILTYDLAKALMTPLEQAERIKTLYGTMLSAESNDQQTIVYPSVVGEDCDQNYTTRSEVRRVIFPRMFDYLEKLRDRISANRVVSETNYSVVLTGEASQLVGLPAVAADVLDRPVRMGRPNAAYELPAHLSGPAFSTVIGMAASVARKNVARRTSSGLASNERAGSWANVRDWLAQSF